VVATPIDIGVLEVFIQTPTAGAVVQFIGRVRDLDHERPVTSLEYEAHPDASQTLSKLTDKIADQYSGTRIVAVHRIGMLNIGDAALVVMVSAAHRQEAFEACSALVEEIKGSLPIWKLQTYRDGTQEWVNCL